MRFIITENKLNKTINNWLSKQYEDLEIYDHNNQHLVLYVDKNGEIIFIYQSKENDVYVSKDVMKFLINIFSIDDKQVKSIFKDWFEEHNNLKTYKAIPWDFSDASDWKKVVRWETKKRLSN
jgi:hypothetical protein